MSIKLFIGRTLSSLVDIALSHPSFPLLRNGLLGWRWEYDVMRFAGTRDIRMVLDVGANTGQTSLQLLQYYPHAVIHAFEPVQDTFAELRANVAGRPQVRPHPFALGEKPGTFEITLQKDSQFNSLRYAAQAGPMATEKRETISVSTVDKFCQAQNIGKVDLLKIDAQGADLSVVQGAEGMLKEHRIRFVLCEVGFQSDDAVNQPFPPLHAHLCARGLRLCGFYEGMNFGPQAAYIGHREALYVDPKALAAP